MFKIAAVLLALVLSAAAHAQTVPTVAAASDLKFALEDIAKEYERSTGKSVKLVFGSSGNFFRQIQQGAPFDMFMSADEAFVDKLAEDGLANDRGTLYAVGRIVLFAPKGSTLKPDDKLADLALAMKDGRLKKFAIANPEHAPYGRAAQEALTALGLWQGVQPSLVLGENVSQAAQFAASGSTQGGHLRAVPGLVPGLRRPRHLCRSAGQPAQAHPPEDGRAQAGRTCSACLLRPPAPTAGPVDAAPLWLCAAG